MEKYQKNALIIFAGLTAILVLFSAIVLGWHYFTKPAPGLLVPLTPEELAKKNAEIGVLNEFKQCQSADYKNLPNFGSDRNDNFYKIAEIIAKKDKTACDAFQDEFWKTNCLKTYYFYRAILDENENYCEELSAPAGSDESSYYLVCQALIRQDLSLCQKITDNYANIICQSAAGDSKAICENIGEDIDRSAAICVKFGGASGQSVNKETCGVMVASAAKADCLNSYYLLKALKDGNIDLCSNINQEEKRFNRLYCLAALSEEPEKSIADFYANNTCIEKYATFLADINNDKSWCEKIPLKNSENKILYSQCLEEAPPILPKTPPIPSQPTSTP